MIIAIAITPSTHRIMATIVVRLSGMSPSWEIAVLEAEELEKDVVDGMLEKDEDKNRSQLWND